jgi:glyoxylase-like metal-dependent hydrolase (beta-lactamase superfamily II)
MPAILLRANNASPWTGPTGTNTYLFRGALPALIDAGVGNPSHLNAIANSVGDKGLSAILLTHNHPDHSGGVPGIQLKWPQVRIVKFGEIDGATILAGDTELRPIHTPGHSPDHLCFFDEREGDLFCGDLVRTGGTIVIPASQGGNMRQYLDSLARVRALKPRRLYPGHGTLIDDPAGVIDEYLQHRAMRETQVIEALQAGAASPEAIVARVYGKLSPALAQAAADSVLAHLQKLREDGKATSVATPWEEKGEGPPAVSPWAWHLE